MVECLKEMLALEAPGPTYIILDALDECPITSTIPSPREDVLELVDELVSLHLPNLHICVTSRPEHDTRIVLERLTENPVSLHDESGQQEDIANYVASFVRSNQRMQRWREEDKNLVIKTLSEKADGMFRWVFCQLDFLRHCFPPSVRRILDELPESLDETYERILREIRKPNQGHAHRMLQCLVVAVRPLRVEELAEVLAFDFNVGGTPKLNPGWRWEDQEEAVMSACSSLVMIVKDGDSRVVQFSHFSVKEFLTADRLAEPMREVSRYHIRLEAAHTILVQACLGVLLRLDDGIDRNNIEGFPLARYAAQYWVTHARVENVSSRIKEGMECLFDADKPHFAAWLWIYNEDWWGGSMSTMHPEKPEAVPLYHAAMFGLRDLAEHLITEHPEHVNARGGQHQTPMHAAADAGHANITSLLIEHGADMEARSNSINGGTPLNRVAWDGRLEVGQYLLDRGADINSRDSNLHTPLIHAVMVGRVEFARMLLERGAEIDARNAYGRTAPYFAAVRGYTQAVRLLLEHGADVNMGDDEGKTASQLATQQEIVELLSKYGAKSVISCLDSTTYSQYKTWYRICVIAHGILCPQA
ncbi:ankyrin repeat-containing domain protein [Russula emetica]|nr:ankyrin repeat-containing domain protein [Russula emetica]